MGLPGGFKPNPNLAEFIGNAIIDLIYIWNFMTTKFIQTQTLIIKSLAYLGLIGSTIQVALFHDTLLYCSSHILVLYTVVAWIYNYILKFLRTLINLFNGQNKNYKMRLINFVPEVFPLFVEVVMAAVVVSRRASNERKIKPSRKMSMGYDTHISG